MSTKHSFILILLIALGIATRLLPHAPNITALGAIALFAGFYFPRRLSFFVPLTAMFVSDLFIGFYDVRLLLVVYASFGVMTLCGSLARMQSTWTHRVIVMLFGSCFFYLATNFAVWLFSDFYPHTLPGLLYSYTLALPFFRNSLVGDIGYSSLLFGAHALVLFAIRDIYFEKTVLITTKSAGL